VKSFVLPDGGRIRQRMDLPDNFSDFSVLSDWVACPSDLDTAAHYFKDGQFHPIPDKPGDGYRFDYTIAEWVLDLDAARELRWAYVKSCRDKREFGTFEYNGMVFDGDADAQRRLGVYVSISKSQPNFSAAFTLANNTEATLSANDFIAIEITKATQVAAAFATAVTLRERILIATTSQELEEITWPE